MSGNWIQEIENIHICPCCKNPTTIEDIQKQYQLIDGEKKWQLAIKFTHTTKANEDIRRIQSECECFDECGGYYVYIPLSEEITQLSQNWY